MPNGRQSSESALRDPFLQRSGNPPGSRVSGPGSRADKFGIKWKQVRNHAHQ
jgi:hypothetical protein